MKFLNVMTSQKLQLHIVLEMFCAQHEFKSERKLKNLASNDLYSIKKVENEKYTFVSFQFKYTNARFRKIKLLEKKFLYFARSNRFSTNSCLKQKPVEMENEVLLGQKVYFRFIFIMSQVMPLNCMFFLSPFLNVASAVVLKKISSHIQALEFFV